MTKPLAGIRVLDLGQFIAAPGAGQIMREMGADVVKIEPLQGDWTRSSRDFGEPMLRAHNRGKRSIALDLRATGSRNVMVELLRHADVLLHNMRPGAMASLGYSAAEVAQINPCVVYASVSGFGPAGPSSMRSGLDIAAQAESGLMSITGEAGGLPLRVGTTIVDAATAHALTEGVLASLLCRERTGTAVPVEVSLLDVAVHLQAADLARFGVGGEMPQRRGNGQPGAAPAADLIKTSDGYVVLSGYSTTHWPKLCALLGHPEFADDPRYRDNEQRVLHRHELIADLSSALEGLSSDECVALLAPHGIVIGAVRDYAQVLEAADIIDNRTVVEGIADDGSSYLTPRTPTRFAGTVPEAAGLRVPRLGEHTREILAEVGLSNDQVDQLESAGVIGSDLAPAQLVMQ